MGGLPLGGCVVVDAVPRVGRELLAEAWEIDCRSTGQLHTRTVDKHVRRLRESWARRERSSRRCWASGIGFGGR